MNSWLKLERLIEKAQKGTFFLLYKPFKVGEIGKEKVGHNSHYRFFWTRKWWESLFGTEPMGKDFIIKNPTRDRYFAHKALDIALDKGPNPVIDFVWNALNVGDEES